MATKDGRILTYHKFKAFAQEKDNRTMDEICTAGTGFELQVQQKFLKEYISENKKWRSLLLYHQIGSGKTCTAITLAETYMDMHPEAKVLVVLPARLRTNFLDELISPCGMERYISAEEFARFQSSGVSGAVKAKLRRKFMAAIEARYQIMSYEKFKDGAFKTKDLKKWVSEMTKDKLIIVDEVHNLLSDKYDEKKQKEIASTGISARAKGSNTILFKYLNDNADPSCRMIYLTATPVFDNMGQFAELVKVMNPGAHIKRGAKISDVIDNLRGKVSFFPGTSPNAYPSTSFQTHEIPLSKVQDHITNHIIVNSQDEDNPDKEAFLVKQRMASVACYPNKKKIVENIPKIAAKLSTFAPKVEKLIDVISKNKGKHVVYSSFIGSSLRLVEEALKNAGWISLQKANKDAELWKKHAYKVYALWDGSIKDADKVLIKSVMNNGKDNLDGKKVRVILGSPSIKEGISFKHVQHLHLIDPVWNSSAKIQVEGRAIRFCSHIDIPANHPFLKRHVVVNIYKSVPRKEGLVQQTADQQIYDRIIPSKQELIVAAEAALKKVAIDYFLFRNMYQKTKKPAPKLPTPGKLQRSDSLISIDDNAFIKKPPKIKRKANTCPKARRPDAETGMCKPEHVLKVNNHGDTCCYKVRGDKLKATKKKETPLDINNLPKSTVGCAKARRPVNGKCEEGFKLKLNKKGSPCCFKIRVSKK